MSKSGAELEFAETRWARAVQGGMTFLKSQQGSETPGRPSAVADVASPKEVGERFTTNLLGELERGPTLEEIGEDGRRRRQSYGHGVVVHARSDDTRRGRRGAIVEQIAEDHASVMRGAGELLPYFELWKIARQRGFARAKVRSEYNGMRRTLRNGIDLARATLVSKGAYLSSLSSNGDFGYVPRRKNKRAHSLAREDGTYRTTDKSDPREAVIPLSFRPS